MQSIWKSRGEKIRTRNIEVTTYYYDGQRIIVEGVLKSYLFQEFQTMTGKKFPSGVTHHMTIRLLVNRSNLLIEDVDVDLLSLPREECRETINCLVPIKGLTITKGFMLNVKKMLAGNKGCTHLLELLQAMAPAIAQGYLVQKSPNTDAFDPERAKKALHFLVNTCHGWREDGPVVENLKNKLNMK